jgi:hypothetical protein
MEAGPVSNDGQLPGYRDKRRHVYDIPGSVVDDSGMMAVVRLLRNISKGDAR